ncbi:MAG TPA: hypothetical protein VGZ22_27370 [Isosphaeraceae bacterium]|nr:hypothetical protein [Isosphaeraceae bacterium]
MKARALILLTTVLLIGADPPKRDLDRLQGTWELDRAQPLFDVVGSVQERWITIQGNVFTDVSLNTGRHTFTLEPSESPGCVHHDERSGDKHLAQAVSSDLQGQWRPSHVLLDREPTPNRLYLDP